MRTPSTRIKSKKPPYFFGWTNTKWMIRECGKIYSMQPSYFSKKRIESGVAFIIGQTGMVMYFLYMYKTLTMTDFIMWAALEFTVAGYMVYQIQKQKNDENYNPNQEPEEPEPISCPTCGQPIMDEPTHDNHHTSNWHNENPDESDGQTNPC